MPAGRRVVLVTLAGLVLGAAPAAQAQTETAGLFARKIAGFTLAGTTNLEKRRRGMGQAAQYRKGGLTAEIALYTLGRSNIAAGFDALEAGEIVARYGTELDAAVSQDVYRFAAAGRSFAVTDGAGSQRFTCTRFNIVTQNSERFDNVVCAATHAGRFVKVRFSGPEGRLTETAVSPFLNACLASL